MYIHMHTDIYFLSENGGVNREVTSFEYVFPKE